MVINAIRENAVLPRNPIMYNIRCRMTVAVDSPNFIPVSFEQRMQRAPSRKTPLGIVYTAKMLARVIPWQVRNDILYPIERINRYHANV
jgi:hypothetical protein